MMNKENKVVLDIKRITSQPSRRQKSGAAGFQRYVFILNSL